jgi:tRNA modification GTPase
LRLAQPGEFTQRAYLNQKMDLAQAEAVSDVIDAQTQAAVRGAGRSLVGAFSKQVEKLQEQLLRVADVGGSLFGFSGRGHRLRDPS